MKLHLNAIIFLSVIFIFSCREKEKEAAIFDLLESARTGLNFNNKLTPKPDLNMLKYMYFYNGAGVGAGDFNNDGLTDLFFAGNQVADRLYLNTGNLAFKDVTAPAGIPDDKGWSTGISVVDINQDGLLDIYVCRVGKYASLNNHNLLLVCKRIGKDGVPVYEDQSSRYGLDFSGFSTQAAFFDADMDGDLDMYLLNHSLRYNSTFQPRANYENTYDSLSGDRLYRNDGSRFTDITRQSGINSSIIGYGLGICVSDINLDGLPDLYIANDFHENDYLYINQGNGTFKDELDEHIMHTSQFSMGVDIGDINNDAYPEIITLDMLPEDPYILKRSLGEDEYNLFNMKLKYGYNHQYTRNNLQFNRGNGMFSEIGFYAGVAATDWSWSPLFMDFDNDGRKDLFISNGIPKRLNDIDYVNYISNDQIQSRIRNNSMDEKDLAFIDKFPQIKLRNKFFSNNGDLRFTDRKSGIANDKPTYSNGAVYADFDNDGDLDIVVNNIDEEAYLYRNNADTGNSIRINLEGGPANKNALGSKLVVYSGKEIRISEKFPVRGFQSSMEIPLLTGTRNGRPDSMILVWPDNSYEKVMCDSSVKQVALTYKKGLPVFNYAGIRTKVTGASFENTATAAGFNYLHQENQFVEFNREPLMPFMVSSEGPALAVGDMNKDGMEDVFVGSSKGNKSALYLQVAGGTFIKSAQPFLDADSVYEDVDALWADVNNDQYPDLLIASGGNEFYGNDIHMLPRLYINHQGKQLVRQEAFPQVQSTASCMVAFDFNSDGRMDIFLGGRAVPFAYGEIPKSYIFINDGRGKFTDATASISPELSSAGIVKDADMADIDGDGKKDLVLALEWGGIVGFVQSGRQFIKRTMSPSKGWWNCIKPVDLDNDGDIDFVLGNLGENSRLKASIKEPVRLYLDDFDGNGTKDQVMSYYLEGQEIPFANKAELEKQMPGMKKKFLYAEDFAKATMDQIFDRGKLNKSRVLSADNFSNALLINEGGMKFALKAMPMTSQFSSIRDAVVLDYNRDGLPDIITGGNFYGSSVSVGRNDADFGTLLINKGKGNMEAQSLPGLIIRNEVRKIMPLVIGTDTAWVVARNSDSLMLIRKRGN